jgi:hypothetical protein
MCRRIAVSPGRASLDERLQDGVPDFGSGDGATGDSGVECGEMMTVEMTDKVGGREAEGVIEMVHKEATSRLLTSPCR